MSQTNDAVLGTLILEFEQYLDSAIIQNIYAQNNNDFQVTLKELVDIMQRNSTETVHPIMKRVQHSYVDDETPYAPPIEPRTPDESNIDFLCSMFTVGYNEQTFDTDVVELVYEENERDISKAMKFLLDCSENNSNLEDDSDFPEEFEGFVEAEPKKEEKPKKKLTQKEKEKEQKRQQREKEKERSIAHLREIFPSIDIEMIRFILKDAKWDATIAFQQLELQAGTSGIQSGAIKTNKKKFRPAQHLLGAANGHTANRWMENVPKITTATTSTQPKVRAPESTQSSLASRIKLEKLQNLTKDAGIPQGVVEIVFGECGTVSKTVQKLHEMYPDVTFNSHHDEQPQKQQPVAPSQLPKIHQTYRYNGGSEIQQSRTIAHDYAQIRNQFFQLALTAFMRGDGAKAKEFSDKGREADRISKEAHREAAQLTFEHMNRKFEHGTNIETMDMHGLRVDEALQQLDSFLLRLTEADEMSKAKSNRLNVITGLGKHSKNGAKIKPAVVQYFKDNDYKFREPWPGVIQCRLRRNQVSQY